MNRVRVACALALLALFTAGCSSPETLHTLSANDSNGTACAEPCLVTVTPTTPFDGVAGTPAPDTPPAEPVTNGSAPPPAVTPAPPTAPAPNATDAAPSANATVAPSMSAPAPATPAARTEHARADRAPRVSIGSSPVGLDGSATGNAWGGWKARPGQARVPGINFIKVVNSGNVTDAIVTLRFDAAAFVGQTDPAWIIPIAGNVEFAAFEDDAPRQGRAPRDATFDFQPATSSTLTVQFHGEANVYYIAYRLVSLPTPLAAQAYSAPYTVSVS